MTTIADLIAWIETKNNLAGVRFEPAIYKRFDNGILVTPSAAAAPILARIKKANACSDHTALMIYSTSWGAHQLMGFNIWGGPLYSGTVADFLGSATAQATAFFSFLRRVGLQDITPEMLAVDQTLRLKFAMTYNGSIAYEKPMLDALAHFKVKGIAVN